MSNILMPTEVVRLHRVWTSILYRCNDRKNKQYKNYGARGISICDEWKDFNKFCHDVGKCPVEGYHLDREDNDKGYSKDNCRWVSAKTNHRNKRNNHYYQTHLGKMCQSEIIEKAGYTKKQFKRCIEKYGEEKFLLMFKDGSLPKKRIVPNLLDIVGKTIGSYEIKTLDDDKSTGARYFCLCKCGKETRVSRFNLINGRSSGCRSCSKLGGKNPNSTMRQLNRDANCT